MMKYSIFLIMFKVFLVIGTTVLPYDNDGVTGKQRVKRVVGGFPGNIENFPFLVSILAELPRNRVQFLVCGGCIISQNIILTAAHCINYNRRIVKNFKVRVGTSYWERNGILLDIKRIVQHENFDSFTYENDIAILILTEILKFNQYINSISLASKARLPGTYSTVMGWGLTNERIEQLPKNFNIVKVPLVDSEKCRNIYFSSHLHEGVICAGYVEGGKDACTMDSGSPLIENGELIGIVSLGDGCARPNRPGVYTDIIYMYNWIANKLKIFSV